MLCAAGGTFALYSLLCRHCNISSLPNRHPTDEELSTFVVNRDHPKTYMQKKLEGSSVLQRLLLLLVLIGTSMVIGDGILTPAISGVSNVPNLFSSASCLSLHYFLFTSSFHSMLCCTWLLVVASTAWWFLCSSISSQWNQTGIKFIK